MAEFYFNGVMATPDMNLLLYTDSVTGSTFAIPEWYSPEARDRELLRSRREFIKQDTGRCPACGDMQDPCKCVSDEAININQEKRGHED